MQAVKKELHSKPVKIGFRCEQLSEAAIKAANETLPRLPKPNPSWWEQSVETLEPLRQVRNAVQRVWMSSKRGRASALATKYKKAVSTFRQAVRRGKNEWIQSLMAKMDQEMSDGNWTKDAWRVVQELKSSLSKTKKTNVVRMKMAGFTG